MLVFQRVVLLLLDYGRNPAPPGMYKTLYIMETNIAPTNG